MNLPHIISKVLREPWLITEQKHHAILAALEGKLGGQFQTMEDRDDMGGDDSGRDEYREFQLANGGTLAVIPVHGVLGKHLSSLEMACGGCSLDTIQSQLKTVLGSPRITKVLLDINSPGGTYTGTPETASLIAEVNRAKPVLAFTDSDCCSGAYWLASQASAIYSTESAEIGSVGVRMILLDVTKQMEMEGVKVNAIYSGKYKLLGASFKPLEVDEREMLQAESDRIHTAFQAAIQRARGVAIADMQGQIYRGEEAAGVGMTDGLVEDFDDVMETMNMEDMPGEGKGLPTTDMQTPLGGAIVDP